MADFGISIVERLIESIGSEIIKEICSMWGYKVELEELNKTITTIKNVLFDADSKRDLSMVQQGYIAELKDAVYDADDLFDEFRTLAELNQIGSHKGGKFFGKVRRFFCSEKNKLSQARRMSRRVKEIKGYLDGIASNYSRFGFSIDYRPIVRRREESCSYVDAKDIIGRDKDKDAIIDLLVAPNGDDEGFRFLTIVGVGGLGKTALAQLVFNDKKIEKEFLSCRLWVCVSDQDGEQFNVRKILSKILEVLTKERLDNSSSKERVQKQFQEQFREMKYLLVLDDVWNEDRDNWVELRKFLMMGAKGSKVVVTSRSEKTGSIIGKKNTYKLEGLSKEDSQRLFEMSAIEEGEKLLDKVKIGENIVRKCCGIPLAIKVVGSLLYGQDIIKWQSIERSGLADIMYDNDKILSILKLSYYNLAPSMKSCFSYCAIFPKDFEISKEMLIDLWIAQRYIVPLDGGQSVEDAAEEHFSILMRRCFFQDIEKDEYGNVVSVKIHDLMHDVAKEIGKEEICVVSSKASKLGETIHHVNNIGDAIANVSLCGRKIRTYISCDYKNNFQDKHIENLAILKMLRVLDLSNLDIKILPLSIDRLLLLRYLKLSWNRDLKVLPDSVTGLYNLQTLILRHCENLREVPNDFSNLINLRHLDFYDCNKLERMPSGILKLCNLRVLPYYVASNELSDAELNVLQQVFTKLKGRICIGNFNAVNDTRIRDSESMLPFVKLTSNTPDSEWVIHEGVLKRLELPPYLSGLEFSGYSGKTIPLLAICFPLFLIHIEIKFCSNLEQIPVLSKLLHLKSLKLEWLNRLEHMENGMNNTSNDTKTVEDFFPSLTSLDIEFMEKLKGWWKADFPEMRLKFPQLTHMRIRNCPNLSTHIVCPSTLEKLELYYSERLLVTGELTKLRKMEIEKVDHLKLLPSTNNCLTSLVLVRDVEVQSAIECVQCRASSLKTLKFHKCKKLRKLPRLDHFFALEKLYIEWSYELRICEDDEEPWKSLTRSLRHLKLTSLPNITSLPKGMQYLTSLKSLHLSKCLNLEGALPEWMSCLSSLQSLKIWNCPGIKSLPEAFKDLISLKELSIGKCPYLKERCEEPNGVDFAKIQHIPQINIGHEMMIY